MAENDTCLAIQIIHVTVDCVWMYLLSSIKEGKNLYSREKYKYEIIFLMCSGSSLQVYVI